MLYINSMHVVPWVFLYFFEKVQWFCFKLNGFRTKLNRTKAFAVYFWFAWAANEFLVFCPFIVIPSCLLVQCFILKVDPSSGTNLRKPKKWTTCGKIWVLRRWSHWCKVAGRRLTEKYVPPSNSSLESEALQKTSYHVRKRVFGKCSSIYNKTINLFWIYYKIFHCGLTACYSLRLFYYSRINIIVYA